MKQKLLQNPGTRRSGQEGGLRAMLYYMTAVSNVVVGNPLPAPLPHEH